MIATIARQALRQGLVELRQSFTGAELAGNLFWLVGTLIAVHLLRGREVAGTDLGLGAVALPGVLGMFVAFGMLLVAQHLATDREDGTVVRARAVPHGIRGYVAGKLVTVSATVLAYLMILIAGGWPLLDGVPDLGRLAWVTVLGLIATQSIGMILGALIASSRGAGLVSMPILGLIAISGIFAPLSLLPAWLQTVAQAFPIYWLGLGMRSAFLPDAAAAVEIGASWRPGQTAAVLGAWAVAGLIVAPLVVRRMARHESGSRVTERRERTLQRVG